MCGIAGSYASDTPTTVRPMVDRLHHRGPDGYGFLNTVAGSLGHTRLAILDIAGGHQPMPYEQWAISFNGEIYNHADLRHHLNPPETMQTRTDTEVVLRLYAQCGPESVARLDGMFAFVILGPDTVFLARDPLGIKPLYTGVGRDGVLYFASEIKALAQMTDDIKEFPPGWWYHSQLGWHQYYTVPTGAAASEPAPTEQEVLPAIRSTLRWAVHKRLMADVPVGVSLSGGLDSSIVTLLARDGVEGLHSFGVGVEGSADLAASQQVAAFLGTKHHTFVYTERDIEAALPEILYYLESFDPALVRSAIPNYFLARLAAEHVKVMLTGEGADELYAGYDYLGDFTEPAALQSELVGITAALHNTNLQRADRMSMAFGLEARVPFLDVQSVDLALGLPPEWKVHSRARQPKALLRQAFADHLPPDIINRPKQKFSQGAGSSDLLAQRAEASISDAEFVAEQRRLQQEWNYRLPNKEALYYYRILREYYRDEWILPGMGRSRSL